MLNNVRECTRYHICANPMCDVTIQTPNCITTLKSKNTHAKGGNLTHGPSLGVRCLNESRTNPGIHSGSTNNQYRYQYRYLPTIELFIGRCLDSCIPTYIHSSVPTLYIYTYKQIGKYLFYTKLSRTIIEKLIIYNLYQYDSGMCVILF